jgi:putative transposase
VPNFAIIGDGRHAARWGEQDPRAHIAFIRRISRENPDWGEDKVALELKLKLGVNHSASTIRRYMVEDGPLRGSTWRTFLGNHAGEILAMDFTTVVMWDDSVCYVLVVLEHRTRRVVATSVTRHPTLSWLKQQIRDACPWDDVRFLIHDNDGIYGQYGKGRGPRCALDAWLGEVMGIRGIPIPYGAPNANSLCERVIGTLRREVLNHFIFQSEGHLCRTLSEYRRYYNEARPHQGIGAIPAELDAPRDVSGAQLVAGL